MHYDVVIVGGGPAGLAAALILARARKRVLLCDSGTPRNAVATEIHGFVTRDRTPPAEFRRIGREQLVPYQSVDVREVRVGRIEGSKGDFQVTLESGIVSSGAVILCVGMIDELPATKGFRVLWGKSIFQCPYCHAWERRDRPFGYVATEQTLLPFGLLLSSWSRDLTAFTDGGFAVDPAVRVQLTAAGIAIEERRIRSYVAKADHLEAIELEDGVRVQREVLFARPPQRQTDLVRDLGLALDAQGFVVVSEQFRETSRPGIFAGGDLLGPGQSAILAAGSGSLAAYMLSHAMLASR